MNYLLLAPIFGQVSESIYAHAGWRGSVGFEFLKFKNIPLRLGYAFGGPTFKELGLGFGYHIGPLISIWLCLQEWVWIHSMQGLNLSLQLTMTSFKGRDTNQQRQMMVLHHSGRCCYKMKNRWKGQV
ncbi:MAG: hypothetical protein Ct9H300mP29_5530 [Candidatus Neomarinimicrobiota bacterium]|nr:MAG: hypothetical protein Ct9H300mP29_5530 [Candidatus Neomarinimicrobiota bacterium]